MTMGVLMLLWELLLVSLTVPTASFSVAPAHFAAVRHSSVVVLQQASIASEEEQASASSSTDALAQQVLTSIASCAESAKEWSDMFGLGSSEAAFYALFRAIRESVPLGLKGQPFVLKQADIVKALGDNDEDSPFAGWFSRADLEKAVEDDFLDADRGSTDNRKGWKTASVSSPRGNSFEDAKMLWSEVESALEQGTVIFNSAGAHIPKLAGANLAITDATSLPCAINIYITNPHQRTSAPPHTDKQDVMVVQTSGKKYWRVYSPPDPAEKPMADMFARGKHLDNLPLYALESEFGCKLLLETTLDTGDILFVPAAFPHTTGTAQEGLEETSIHLTFGIDTHIWDQDYLSARRFALRRAGVVDTALGQVKDEDNRYVGAVNELPHKVHTDLFDALPLGLLDDDAQGEALVETASTELERISREVDAETASAVAPEIWKDAVARVRQEGMELLDIHRDMFLAAIEEGRTREQEDAMTAHIGGDRARKLTPERIQRLSLFRVKDYFENINNSMQGMLDWSHAGTKKDEASALPDNWEFTLPVNVGDEVEADLGGAFFPATVVAVRGNSYDVQFFDGDKETGMDRSMLKLLKPPAAAEEEEEVDTSNMTAKQLKRWKKQQAKKKKRQKQ